MHVLCITFMYYFELLYDPKTGDLYCYADEKIIHSNIYYLIFYQPLLLYCY